MYPNDRVSNKPLNLARTEAVLAAYDAVAGEWPDSDDDVSVYLAALDALGEAVGYAFGLDTADRNNAAYCKAHIRPGHPPSPGNPESFVRKAVREWREKRDKENA